MRRRPCVPAVPLPDSMATWLKEITSTQTPVLEILIRMNRHLLQAVLLLLLHTIRAFLITAGYICTASNDVCVWENASFKHYAIRRFMSHKMLLPICRDSFNAVAKNV